MRYTYGSRGEGDLFVSYFPMEGPRGVDRVTSVLQDISDLKLFRTLIDNSNDAVEVVDPATLRFLDVHEKACKDLGYTREELLALTEYDIDRDVRGLTSVPLLIPKVKTPTLSPKTREGWRTPLLILPSGCIF
jgi:PAS domain-containing protein